jgi:ketosteroid isomerase-like protein
MSIYTELKKAIDNRDIEAWIKIYHDDYIFIRHQSGTKMNREEFLEMGEKMMSNKALTFNNSRCIYENDDILVEHSVMGFPDGTREAVLVVHTKKEGKIIRTETGVTPLT